jgi:hypothetical protein
MAVCNLFNELTSTSGNFLMFSQYVEDITRNFSDGDNFKIVPSKFIALNIEYSKINIPAIGNSADLNTDIPKYFQNYFENGCAFGKDMFGKNWTSKHAKNLFWNSLFKGGFITTLEQVQTVEEGIEVVTEEDITEPNAVSNSVTNIVKEIKYCGDINMHSYNNHQGMGYGELYCYIPTDGNAKQYSVSINTNVSSTANTKAMLEGFEAYANKDQYKIPTSYNTNFKTYSYDENYNVNLTGTAISNQDSQYDINTIIVLYSVYQKSNTDGVDTWSLISSEYADIPMGIYFAGCVNTDKKLTNTITKHIATSYDTGTSYGLRICTRFSATAQGKLITDTNVTADNSGNTNFCQLMTAMSENLERMYDVVKTNLNNSQDYKDLLSIIRNNRTNVPYVKKINNKDYWFVNGQLVTPAQVNCNCQTNA